MLGTIAVNSECSALCQLRIFRMVLITYELHYFVVSPDSFTIQMVAALVLANSQQVAGSYPYYFGCIAVRHAYFSTISPHTPYKQVFYNSAKQYYDIFAPCNEYASINRSVQLMKITMIKSRNRPNLAQQPSWSHSIP